jgi:serine/threonine-protein kinase
MRTRTATVWNPSRDNRDVTDPITPESFVGERIRSRFVVERMIGHGPLSTAFRASDELLQRRVTVKLFHPQHPDDVAVVESQLELATAVARLSHPNIVTVIDRGEHDGMPFVVLEHVRGENFQERIDRFAPLPVAEVVGYGADLARALAYAHAQGVVHGNLRPGNVLISEDREVKVVDFGGGSYLATLTGTDPYLAPERRLHDGPSIALAPAEDIYALGVLLFAALTETEPRGEIDPGALQMLRPDASPRLAAVVARAMAPSVEDRHSSMHELASDLAAVRPAGGARTVRPDALDLADLAPWERDGRALAAAEQTMVSEQGAAARGEADDDQRTLHGVPPAPPERREREPVYRSRRELRARLLVWSMVVVPLAALVLVGVLIAGERARSQRTAPRQDRTLTGTPIQQQIVGAHSYDPYGDKTEHEELVHFIHDGKPDTDRFANSSWKTEGYKQQQMGKPGVGVWVRLARPVQATQLDLQTALVGWGYTVYGASGEAPAQLAQWHQVSGPSYALNKPVHLDTHGQRYDTYLIWVTRLDLDTADPSATSFRARIGEVAILAPPAA